MDPLLLLPYGIDYQKGVSRCLDDAAFYEKLLSMFLSDDAFKRACEAGEARDKKAFFACMHELKGACGNVALTDLYEAVCPLVDLLRTDASEVDWAEADRSLETVKAAYSRACEGIALALGK